MLYKVDLIFLEADLVFNCLQTDLTIRLKDDLVVRHKVDLVEGPKTGRWLDIRSI